MIDPALPDPADDFELVVAPRVRGLPPYLFGKINDVKYRKRRDGVDVIDLGMGNPTDPPEPWVIDKLCEAAHDLKNHRYSVAAGVYNLRREVAAKYADRFGVTLDPDHEVVATIGSKEGFSHMCLALLGPGDTALAPAPSFPIHMHAVALASANVITLDVREPRSFLANVARVCESLFPRPKILILNFPHNPTGTIVDRAFYEEVVARWRRSTTASSSATSPTATSSSTARRRAELPRRRRGRASVGCGVHDDVEGLQHGRLARRVRRRQPEDARGPEGDQGLLRLRPLPGRAGRGDRRPAARRARAIGPGGRVCQQPLGCTQIESLRRLGWNVETPRAGMFAWAEIPEPWKSKMGSIDFAMKLLEEANVAVSPGRGFGEAGEGFLRLGAHRERAAAEAGRPPDRPVPQAREGDELTLVREGDRHELRVLRASARMRRLPGCLCAARPGPLRCPLPSRRAAGLSRVRGGAGLPPVQDSLRWQGGRGRVTRGGGAPPEPGHPARPRGMFRSPSRPGPVPGLGRSLALPIPGAHRGRGPVSDLHLKIKMHGCHCRIPPLLAGRGARSGAVAGRSGAETGLGINPTSSAPTEPGASDRSSAQLFASPHVPA